MTFNLTLQPHGASRLGDILAQSFADAQWSEFRAAVAFVKRSGTKHVCVPLAAFVQRGGRVKFSAGIDAGGTSREGLEDLLTAIGGTGELYVFKNANSSTFHPKVFLFKNDVAARLLIGSGNLTEGGLYTNYEAGVAIDLSIAEPEHAALLSEVEAALDGWSTPVAGNCYLLDNALLARLAQEGWTPNEAYARGGDDQGTEPGLNRNEESLFASIAVPRAPVVAVAQPEPASHQNENAPRILQASGATDAAVGTQTQEIVGQPAELRQRAFLMTLQNTDVGVGQTRPGTQRRSAEVFIPLVCRDQDPEFWGWPNLFVEDESYTGNRDAHGRGKMDRVGVRIRIGGEVVTATIWYNSDKKDVRIRSEDLRSAGNVGDILYMEMSSDPAYDYYVDVIPQGTSRHAEYLAMCVNPVRNSLKQWVYI